VPGFNSTLNRIPTGPNFQINTYKKRYPEIRVMCMIVPNYPGRPHLKSKGSNPFSVN